MTEVRHQGRLRRLLTEGTVGFGSACSIPHPFALEQLASAGFDWIFIDMQHGLSTYADLSSLCLLLRARGVTPLVRVPFDDTSGAQRALDAGAEGIIFPYVENGDDAERAASACRYPPRGTRSFGPYRSPYGADIEYANEQVLCLPMIESVGALGRLDEILAADGVDGVFVGPNDLSISMGGGPVMASLYAVNGDESTTTGFAEAVASIRRGATRHGKFAGISVATGEAAVGAVRDGFDFVGIGGDTGFLQAAARVELQRAIDGLRPRDE
jgi:4-hydroxy-2-oxoheptanedioate aldolase